jgi:hypothetical protein
VGDNINVGSFRMSVTLRGIGISNYALAMPAGETELFKTYTIHPAQMTGNRFVDRTVMFTGGSFSILSDGPDADVMYLNMLTIESGASVIFNGPTSFTMAGVYTIVATIFKANHITETLVETLTIERRPYAVVPFTSVQNLMFGQSLPALQANAWWGETTVDGTISLDAGQTLQVGRRLYSFTFIPFDLVNYGIVYGTMYLEVEKAAINVPLDSVKNNMQSSLNSNNPQDVIADIIGNPSLSSLAITVTFEDTAGRKFTTFPTRAGRYTMTLRIEGNEDFREFSETISFVIEREVEPFPYVAVGASVGGLAAISALFFVIKASKKRKI